MHVENKTIIITDPCYVVKDNPEQNPYPFPFVAGLRDKMGEEKWEELRSNYRKWERDHDDWEKCAYGENMEALGIHNYLSSNTIYGDWSCTTYNTDTKEVLGHFCADAGMVAVFELDEVLKYDPDFNYHTERPWTTTTIENFTGDIDIDVFPISGVDENGKEWEYEEVRVIGKGNINFYTTQTGL